MSTNTCSIRPPPTSTHFVYRLTIPCRTLGNISGISRMTPSATCIRAVRSCCVSTSDWPSASPDLNPLDYKLLSKDSGDGFAILKVYSGLFGRQLQIFQLMCCVIQLMGGHKDLRIVCANDGDFE